MDYPEYMLNGIRIYSSDAVWQQIFSDWGAVVVDRPEITDVNFDLLNIILPASPMNIKTAILSAMDNTDIINQVLGPGAVLSRVATQIIVCLYKSGGMSAADLRTAIGYAPDAATHAIDTAIYQMRKTYGRDLIQNENGIYKLGRI